MFHHSALMVRFFRPREFFVTASVVLATACGGSSAFDAIATQQATSTVDPGGSSTVSSPVTEDATATPEGLAGGGEEYTVQPGDTLSLIAGNFGVTVDELAEANDIDDPNQISVGQVLQIPGGQEN